jgi:hypothetical protein
MVPQIVGCDNVFIPGFVQFGNVLIPFIILCDKGSAGFVRRKMGKRVASFIKQKVASSSAFFV